jgi:DNA-binding beta-propeller fold protein YncE
VLSLVLAGVLLAEPVAVPVPGGEGGIGFDDLVFSAPLRRFIVPGGRTGSVFLLDPATRRLEPVGTLSKLSTWQGGHGQSVTSADARADTLFVADRTTRRLFAIPVGGKGAPAEAPLASGPDYVRWVEPTGEVWVTEPDASAIEIFKFEARPQPSLVHAGRIAVADGPESLVIDPAHGRAYTNTWHDRTLAIGLRERSVAASWSNGCKDARGLDADRARGLLLVGCADGAVTVIDTAGKGRLAGKAKTGAGVDIVAYAPSSRRLYVPAGKAATLEAFEVKEDGSLRSLWTAPAASQAHCVAADDAGHVLVCDPPGGRLLMFEDTAGPAR